MSNENKPIVQEVFCDNGEHSHWTLINPQTGEKLWSEDPTECKAMGYPVMKTTHPQGEKPKTDEEIYHQYLNRKDLDLEIPRRIKEIMQQARTSERAQIIAEQKTEIPKCLQECYLSNEEMDTAIRDISGRPTPYVKGRVIENAVFRKISALLS